jgi:predicted dienelactone hydrolase
MEMKYKTYAQCLSALLVLNTIAAGQVATHQPDASTGTPQPTLPVPSGTYYIGRQAFDLIDTARTDQFSPDAVKHRELMIYIWYPARHSSRQPQGEYLPGASRLDKNPAARQAMQSDFGPLWPLIVSGSITSHAISNAPPVTQPGGFPVVLFSHGLTSEVSSYTAQIEDLVSHGYVVVGIEHTDAAGAVLFPDGRIRLFRNPPAPPSPPKDPLQAMITSAEEGTQTGAEDVRFVLDTLAQGKISLVKMMDLKRVAAVGHSSGGTLTARACQLDPRIKACISEDGEVNPVGAFFDYPDHTSLSQPFLLAEIDWHPTDAQLARMRESRTQWNEYLAHERQQLDSCGAGSYHVVLSRPGMAHASFSDGLLLSAAPGSTQASVALSNLLLTETLARSFLDKYLKNETAPLLDQDAKTPSGVTVERIGK